MRHTRSSPAAGVGGRRRVLVLSASMGAGHDGAARELAARLRAGGHHAEVRDFLDAGPLRIGAALRGGYELELRHAPGAYDATYRMWHRVPWLCPVVAWLVTALTRRRVLRWVRQSGADLVVSTYPLATLCLGRLRRLGRLRATAVNLITDFGVHPLWVHRGMDCNLAVHEGPAAVAAARTGRPSLACGPLVDARFDGAPATREVGRAHLGLGPADRAVLVVAGSWGIGDIDDTIGAVAAGGFVPVVVCGRDEALQRRVRERVAASGSGRAVVLGWTDRMPELMASCDALVENAGGLTGFEAMRVGLPVVSYNPIAGHGRDNTAAMDAAGVSTLAPDRAALTAALDALTRPGPRRRAQVAAASAMFRADGAALALEASPADRPGVAARGARAVAAAAAAAALAWAGLTTGVGVAAAEGAGVATAPGGGAPVAYIGVRLDAAALSDPTVLAAVRAAGASVVVDQAAAEADPAAVAALGADGADLVDGGAGRRHAPDGSLERPAPWNRAAEDVAAARVISALAGRPVALFAPGRRITAFDLYDCGSAHLTAVVPDAIVRDAADVSGTPLPHPGAVYLVDAPGPGQATVAVLDALRSAVAGAGLHPAALSALRG